MGKEAIGYLEPDAQVAIETWVTPILPLLDKYPHLCDLDLVIEGGVGNGVEMAHVIRWLLPQAVYVGTDLVEGVAPRMQRQLGFYRNQWFYQKYKLLTLIQRKPWMTQ